MMNSQSQNLEFWNLAGAGNFSKLGKLLSAVENDFASTVEILKLALELKCCPIIGITGAPGVGKSSIITQFIRHLRSQNFRVAVIAVDPSNPGHGGALLGDRIRWSDHYNDPGVFIRSLGSRAALGGLSRSCVHLCNLLSALPFDIVIVETVGIGQNEIEISRFADQTVLVMVPESGDSIQTLKSGAMEFADLFVVNKCDRPGSEKMVSDIQSSLELQNKTLSIFSTMSSSLESYDVFSKFVSEKCDLKNRKPVSLKRKSHTLKILFDAVFESAYLQSLQQKNESTENPYSMLENIKNFVSKFETSND